jgi:predicted GNAT family N-acyltransferase
VSSAISGRDYIIVKKCNRYDRIELLNSRALHGYIGFMSQKEYHISVINPASSTQGHELQLLLDCFYIREQVFCNEQQVPLSIEQDGRDSECIHILLWEQDIPIGTMRIRSTDEGIKFERIAVLIDYRGRQYGKLMVHEGIKTIRALGKSDIIYLHAQKKATGFYEHMGFVPTGEDLMEAGIAHITMLLPQMAEEHFIQNL